MQSLKMRIIIITALRTKQTSNKDMKTHYQMSAVVRVANNEKPNFTLLELHS